MTVHGHTRTREGITYLTCNACGKQVSSGFTPLPTELGPELIVRAWIQCPECIERGILEEMHKASPPEQP